jgi:Tfp pilus assembly protein PilN
MSARLGLELGPELVRAVRLEGWGRGPIRVLELHWDPAEPAALVSALRENLGTISRMAVAVDLSFLFAKQVRLPPVSATEKRRILMLEPERFFPVRGEELLLAPRGEDNLVFAARASMVGEWLEALEALAPVELVEAGPVSLARALGRVDAGDATILMEGKDRTVNVAEVRAGRVRRIHRTSDPAELDAWVANREAPSRPVYYRPLNGNRDGLAIAAEIGELPSVAGVVPSHLAAYGAALGLGHDLDEALLPADLARGIVRRRQRSTLLAGLACVAALSFALLSLDGFRSRTLHRLEVESARIRQPAESVLTLQRQADALGREARAVAAIQAERMDPLAALAALTRRLPPEAYISALRTTGKDWQIDGYAREAAPLVARLEDDPRFEGVHFLSATSRTRMNGILYESFSIALRLVPAP